MLVRCNVMILIEALASATALGLSHNGAEPPGPLLRALCQGPLPRRRIVVHTSPLFLDLHLFIGKAFAVEPLPDVVAVSYITSSLRTCLEWSIAATDGPGSIPDEAGRRIPQKPAMVVLP